MKKIIITITMVLGFFFQGYSQEMLKYVKSKIENHLSNSLEERYKGGVEINDATEYNGYYLITGTFRYQIQTLLGGGNTVTRKFKSKVKIILDDVIVQKLCYVYIIYGYSDTPEKSCKCTDGGTIFSDNTLFVN